MAAGFIEFIGGKLGRYAQVGTQRYWTPLRVLLMFAVIFLGLAYLSKAYCLESVLPGAGLGSVGSAGSSGGAGATTGAGEALLNWSGNRQYTAACYSDTIAGYTQFSYSFPYNVPVADAPKSPVLSTLFGWVMYWISAMVGVVVRLVGLQIAPPVVYFAVTAVTLSILWMITVRIMVDLTGSRVWDTLLLTCSPVVIVHAFTHWEILSITTWWAHYGACPANTSGTRACSSAWASAPKYGRCFYYLRCISLPAATTSGGKPCDARSSPF